jgi:hypothetical protein
MTNPARPISRGRRAVLLLILYSLTAVVAAALYLGFTALRTRPIYRNIKMGQRGWRGRVHKADPLLGFVPIPNSAGAEIMPVGPEVAMRYDGEGFRVPVTTFRFRAPRPLLLTLGCSFTYGAATPAEETYPYLVAQSLGGTVRNAAVCSYGLSQMLLLARRLVPKYRPDDLIVQYSPWLVERAQDPFAPTYFARLPVPYFYDDRGLALHPPVFRTKLMDLPTDRYRTTPRNAADFGSFLWHVGLPLFLHDDGNMILYRARRLTGSLPPPAANGNEIERRVYAEMGQIARDNRARLVIVIMGRKAAPVPVADHLFPADAVVVDAQAALLAHLRRIDDAEYARSYAHWRGVPPRQVHDHPNPAAHRIIADAIVARLKAN